MIEYILADHMFSKLIRLLDFLISSESEVLSESVVMKYILAINWCAGVIVSFYIGGVYPVYSGELENININEKFSLKYPREQIDGDNHYISLTSARLLSGKYDSVIGIALGGIGCAAIVSCYLDKPLGVMKLSYYDDVNKNEEIPFYCSWGNKGSILLVDDNCGSGKTLNKAAQYVREMTNSTVSAYATELHWEKYFRNEIYQHQGDLFNINELTELSSWCFRHFELIRLLSEKKRENSHLSYITTAHWIDYSATIISTLQRIFPERKYFSKLVKSLDDL